MKKILIILILIVSIISPNFVNALGDVEKKAGEEYSKSVENARDANKDYYNTSQEYNKAKEKVKKTQKTYDENSNVDNLRKLLKSEAETNNLEKKLGEKQKARNEAQAKSLEAKKELQEAHDKACESSGECFEKPSYMIGVPFNNIKGNSVEEKIDNIFTKIIDTLMIGIGVLSTLIMVIGGGFMILHGGKDEILNKGKTIFMSGIYAMVLSLGSYILVKLILNIIYN